MYECAQSSIVQNNLNLPVYDIHEQQARDQVLMNLQMLAQSSSTVSQRHIQKCQEQQERIEKLKQRIMKCKERMDTLGGLNQAIVFVSPSQYPTKYEFNTESNRSRFSDFLHRASIHKLDMKAQYVVKHDIRELGKKAKLEVKDLDDFVLYMFGKLKGRRPNVFEKGKPNKKKIESLGRIPSNIRFLDGLTVFNTHINPYRKYELTTNMVEVVKKDTKAQADMQQMMQEEGFSSHMLTDYTKTQFESDAKIYRPEEKDWEETQWDDDLGLAGVVDIDTAFNDDTTNFRKAKKKVVAEDSMVNSKVGQSQQPAQSQASVNPAGSAIEPSLPSGTASLPPPPPPPSLSLPPPPPSGLTASLPPPPPSLLPPPPPPSLSLPPPILAPPSLPAAPAMTQGASDRNALLKEIENPNQMKRLRRTVTKQYNPVAPRANTIASSAAAEGDRPSQPSAGPPAPLSFADEIKMKIMRRHKALHPEPQEEDEEHIEI